MSESKERRKRLDSSVLNTALLDEIAGRLLSLENHFKDESPEGIVEPLAPLSVITTRQVVGPPNEEKNWFSASIINDGPNYCWVIINTGRSSTTAHRIVENETYEVNFTKALIYDLMLWTDAGATSVRITGTR